MGRTRRVVVQAAVPCRASSPEICLLTVGWATPRYRAAREKLPASTTRTKAAIAERRSGDAAGREEAFLAFI